jgi:hypothetical protein
MLRAWAAFLLAAALPAYAGSADALRASYAAMQGELADSGFGRPLHIESREDGSRQTGDIYAAIDMPFRTVAAALRSPERWCDILVLPANVQRCSAADGSFALYVARKPQDPPEDAYRVDLNYRVLADDSNYREVLLSAPSGPMGTRNYRIRLEAAPLDGQRSFMHLSYSYALGLAARIAMQAYFATSGRDKTGFSIVDRQPDGRPVYVDGARGAVERNAMRYYLAVEAFLESLQAPPRERLETRLRDWYDSIDRYPQLKEDVGRDEYLRLKRKELSWTGRRASQ